MSVDPGADMAIRSRMVYNWTETRPSLAEDISSLETRIGNEKAFIDRFAGVDERKDDIVKATLNLELLRKERDEKMREWNARLWHLYHQPSNPNSLIQETSQLVDTLDASEGMLKLQTLGTMGKLTPVKTGSAVGYTEAKTKTVLQAIWVAIKDLATKDSGSILSILKEALDIVVRPAKSLAERDAQTAGTQLLVQV